MKSNTSISAILIALISMSACSPENKPDINKLLLDSSQIANSPLINKEPEKFDTIKGLFSGLKYADTCEVVKLSHNIFIDSLIQNKDHHLPFDYINSFKIVSLKVYSFNYNWKAFIIEGLFLPTEVPYYYYGAVNNNSIRQPEFFSQPVDISLSFEKYAFTKLALAVYGKRWTDACSDHNSAEHKELSLLVSAYDDFQY